MRSITPFIAPDMSYNALERFLAAEVWFLCIAREMIVAEVKLLVELGWGFDKGSY